LAAVPTGIAFSGVDSYNIPLTWSSGGSGPGVTYGVLYSTASNPSSPAGAVAFGSAPLAGASYTAVGLSSATAYWFQVRAINNNGIPSSYSSPVSTVTTSSGTISAAGFSSVGSSSLTVVWNTNWPAGTMYYSRISSGSFPNAYSGNASSDTLNPGAWFSGLNPNSLYHTQVGTTPAGPFTLLGSTTTLAAVPTGVAFGAPGVNAIPLTWSAAGNGSGVTYSVLYSTASDPSAPAGAVVVGTTAVSTGLTASGLAPATTYYFKVRAINNNGIPSSYSSPVSTPTLPNGSLAPAGFSGVGTSSLTAAWTSDWPNGTVYYSRISSGAFPNGFSGNASSDTLNPSAWFSGLAANVTYYVELGTSPAGPFIQLGSTSSLAAVPTAAGFDAPGISTLTVNWSAAGNGPGVTYTVQYSTAANPSVPAGAVVSSGTTGATSFTATGLSLTTLYYFQVRAINNNNVPSSYTTPVSATTVSTGAVATAGFSAIGTASLTAAWTSSWPSGTAYYSRISSGSFPNSFSGNASSDTLNLSAWFGGLSANATYYVQVATNPAGPFIQVGSTSTLAAVPTGLALSPPGVSTVTLSWSSAGNGAGVTYRILYSTASNPSAPAGAVVVSSLSPNASLSATGLNPAATFYFQVCAVNNNGVASAYASPVSTATWPDGLISPAGFSGIGTSALTAAWGSSFWPGTQYFARVSSGPFPNSFSGNSSSDTYNSSAWFSGLNPNVTYYVQVATSAGGPFTQLGSTSSLAAVPSGLAFGPVANYSIPVTWSAGGNGPGVTYGLLYSTAADPSSPAGAAVTSASTGTASFNAAGLSSATAYYFQVRAFNNNGIPSSYSAPVSTVTVASGTIAATGFSGVGTTALIAAWASNWPAGTMYYAQLSSGPFPNGYSGNSSSNTLNLSAGFNGMGTNVLYYAQVGTTPAGPFTPLGSTATLAAAPVGTAVVSSSYTLVNMNWSSNGNPSGTNYELWQDVNSGFPSPVIVTVSTAAAAASGLSPDTVYYWKVRALSQAGAATSFDAVVSTRTSAAPAVPGAPGAPTPSTVWSTAISWTWAAASGADSYRLYSSTSPTIVMAAPGAPPFVQTGLLPNASYGVLAAGANAAGIGPKTASAQVVTLANQPAATNAYQSGSSSGTVTWTANGNPAGTVAEVQRSTNGITFESVFTAPATAYINGGLIGCTSYFFKVRYANSVGAFSVFDTLVWFRTWATTAAPAGSFTAESLAGNKIGLSWTPSPTEGVVGYRLYGDGGTGVLDYGTPLAVLGPAETSYTTGVLLSSAAYSFVLRASHRCGNESPLAVYASAGSVGALAAVRAGVKTPGSGHHVNGNRVTVNAELLAGTNEQVSQIALQYRPTGGAWVNITAANPSHPNPSLEFPWLTHWDVTGLASGSYDLRAVAYNVAGSSDPAAASITIVVDPVNPTISETMNASGDIVKQQVVEQSVTTSITSSGSDAGDPVAKITLPPNTIADSSATIQTICNPTITTAMPSGLTAVGSAVKIDLTSGQSLLNGTAQVTLTYPETVGDPSRLQIISLNEATGQWATDISATVNTTSRTITGLTTHFSIFAVITGGPGPMANLDSIRVYPVPWKPNGGNADEGKPFTTGDPTSGIIFDRLPVAVGVKIYTLRGRLVAQFNTEAGTGAVRWDGKNMDDRDVASGGYFAVISAPGLKSVVKRIVIIR
jgi:titin